MSVRVGPDEARPTHHISLSDGVTTIGYIISDSNGHAAPEAITRASAPRTALKTTSGNQGYGDLEPPWSYVVQGSFLGGMGKLDYDDDVTRYYDGKRANTFDGRIILGPQENLTTGIRTQDYSLPGANSGINFLGAYLEIGNTINTSFVAGASYNAEWIYLLLRRVGTPGALTVALQADNAGAPDGTDLCSDTVSVDDIDDVISRWWRFDADTTSLTSGTTYWIVITGNVADNSQNHWEIGRKVTLNDGSDDTLTLAYRITNADPGNTIKFFQYKGAQYVVRSGSTINLFINGDRGAADANTGALSTLIDATKSWTADEWIGCVVLLVGGLGSAETKPWRTITDNDGTTLTVDSDWIIEHDTTTEYVILNSDVWNEVATHGITVAPTDILVVNGIVYFAQGDGVNIRRMQWTAAGGYAYADDGTNKATYLATVYDATNGIEVWKANNDTIGAAKSAVKAWGTNLTFGTAITMPDTTGKIRSLIEYGDTVKYPFALREGMIFYVSDTLALPLPLPEMAALQAHTNGVASCTVGVYLYFNYAGGIERFYNSTMDDVGPNRDDGLPDDRQGVVNNLMAYPGRLYATMDAGASGYSSLLKLGSGWHEEYRCDIAGLRIQDIQSQSVPGALDRLWMAVGDDIFWLGMPSDTLDPTKDSAYLYTHECAVTTGYMYAGLYDVVKYVHSLKLFTENLTRPDNTFEPDSDPLEYQPTATVAVDYQLDTETTWTEISDVFGVSNIEEIALTNGLGVNAKRIRFRLRVRSADNTLTPIIKTMVLEIVSRVPIKYSYSIPYRIRRDEKNLLNEMEDLGFETRYDTLDQWAKDLTPLLMRSIYGRFDNMTVFLDSPPSRPGRKQDSEYIDSITVIEV